MKKGSAVLITVLGLLLGAMGSGAYLMRAQVLDAYEDLSKPELPEERAAGIFTGTTTKPTTGIPSQNSSPSTSLAVLPPLSSASGSTLAALPPERTSQNAIAGINLGVPFTSQAPHKNWDMPYQEACEEASLIMVDAFNKGISLTPESSDAAIKKLVAWEEATFGYYEDTDVSQVVRMLKEYFKYSTVIVDPDVSTENIRKYLAQGHPVIIPAAGRLLKNPNFTPPGPLYHMLVIKGFTKDGLVITNDPGTRKGHNYLYNWDTLNNAIHDWNGGDVVNGKRVMIVAY